MKKVKILLPLITLLLLIGGMGCEKSGNTTNTFQLTDFSYVGCKETTDGANSPKSSNGVLADEQEYIMYKAVNPTYLEVQHINAVFNCCPGKLIAESAISNDTIKIMEDESEHSCDCICKYDLHFKIGPLNYKKYHIVLYKSNRNYAEFDLDFNITTDGVFTINPQKQP